MNVIIAIAFSVFVALVTTLVSSGDGDDFRYHFLLMILVRVLCEVMR